MSDGTLLFETGSLADVRHRDAGQLLPVGGRRGHQVPRAGVQRRAVTALAEQLHRRRPHTHQQHVRPGPGFFARILRACPNASRSRCEGRSSTDRSAPAVEGAVGFHWFPFNTRGVWLAAEAIAIKNSPVSKRALRLLRRSDGRAVPRPVPRPLLTHSSPECALALLVAHRGGPTLGPHTRERRNGMLDQLFDTFRKASESSLHMQQDMFKYWTQQLNRRVRAPPATPANGPRTTRSRSSTCSTSSARRWTPPSRRASS